MYREKGSGAGATSEFFSRELTLDEKLELIQEHLDGRSLNRCLTALGVWKGTWHYRMRGGSRQAEREARDEALKPKVLKAGGG